MQQLFDYNLAKKYSGGYEQVFLVLVKSFLKSYETFSEELTVLVDNKDFEKIHQKVHSLKGISLNLGSTILYENCNTLLQDLYLKKINTKKYNTFICNFDELYDKLSDLKS